MDGAEMIEALCQFQPPWSVQLVAWTHKKRAEGAATTTNKGYCQIPSVKFVCQNYSMGISRKGQKEPDQDISKRNP